MTGPASAQDLVKARGVLLEPVDGRRRLAPEALRTALVDLHDFWLAGRAAAIGIGGTGSGIALAAVGALGRRELAPHSDLDLVLLHEARTDVDHLAEQIWYPLWDAGIGLDHSVRTPGQAVQVAATDLRAAFGLLELRHIAGDGELTDRVHTAVRTAWRSGVRGRFDEIADGAADRWRRNGDVAHRVEPDLKNGHGGLRDVQLIDALAAAQLLDRPAADVAAARMLLLDVRTELHRLAGRARDVLRAQDADEAATTLELGDRFELARALSGAARAVAFAAEVGLRSARVALPRRGLAALRRPPVRRPLDSGVVEHMGEVVLARDASAARDPALVLRVAATAARTGLPVAASTLHRLSETAPELKEPWPRDALGELLSLLGTGRGMIDVVEAMDRTGLWGRLLPEWGAVRDLPPRDRAHVWTVDRHLVETCAQSARLTTRVGRPDLLLVGALLHDIGKGRGADHSVVGADLARQIGHRLGFPAADVDVLGELVRHHLLLPHTATRRDLDDPATVERVVDTLGGAGGRTSALLLDLLAALAEADSLATGPGVWSPWKQRLIGDLARRARALMAGEPLPRPTELGAEARALAAAVRADGKPQVSITGDRPAAVAVAMPHAPGTLAAAAGVLALHSLEVHAAEIRSVSDAAGDVVVHEFTVTPRFGSMPDPALVRSDLVRVVAGSLSLPEALARKERDYAPAHPDPDAPAPRVLWFDDEASGGVVLELRGTDRIGLLHRVASALEQECGLGLRWARVSTLGASVVDSFGVSGPGPGGALAADRRAAVEHAVLTAAGAAAARPTPGEPT
ncbi:bifunctional uridylyltransferase/uridylyl-removing enzyme [Pseudonocardia sulfidoxydans NBRC 16205]|uniref:Bifunctional uridylyltransferase/uridylyl-removing enzyme n=1 Tax=Pseudonocardia sulfidoxydans NBRC 16205 TaxID=1223511 RepID=A0A511DP92_9PSEU|nr:[protein-PII] uridylyltransferase [Pseudonocardia sulfidoxydans]GEL26649.1 bifunctional uridylyltransferase/uridylyl-removing enzyme [Pseudonocardia sulfidoxydans NBRC 16205]